MSTLSTQTILRKGRAEWLSTYSQYMWSTTRPPSSVLHFRTAVIYCCTVRNRLLFMRPIMHGEIH